MTIGEKIKALRNLNGLSMQKLADRTGISKGAVQSYESGKVIPKDDRLKRISIVLGVTPEELTDENFTLEEIEKTSIKENALSLDETIESNDELNTLLNVDLLYIIENLKNDQKRFEETKSQLDQIISDNRKNIESLNELQMRLCSLSGSSETLKEFQDSLRTFNEKIKSLSLEISNWENSQNKIRE